MSLALPPKGPEDTDHLLKMAAEGDSVAVERLLERHRKRLHRMIALRLDDRVAARVDASDVVQEALADAAKKLSAYARDRPLPFYAWLHRLAAECLVAVHRRHWRSQARSVRREQADGFAGPDSSAQLMVNSLVADDTTPAQSLLRDEERRRLHAALQRLSAVDREILMMRYLEELSFPQIAAIVGIGEGAAKMRHLRALQHLRTVIGHGESEVSP